MRSFALGVATSVIVAAASAALALRSGWWDVAADAPHVESVTRVITWARDRSIGRRAASVVAPADLSEPERARRGGGNYDAMCSACHRVPGMPDEEVRKGLYPAPPDLTHPIEPVASSRFDERRFWVIKHGVKASGMPSWSKAGVDDPAIWDLVAFLRILPTLNADTYHAWIASSPGHFHSGGAQGAPVQSEPRQASEASNRERRGHTRAEHQHSHKSQDHRDSRTVDSR